MKGSGGTRGLPKNAPSTWLVWLLGLGFIGLGLLFLLAPPAGAALFGLSAPEGESFGYLPAIGLRDLAFGLYLLILSFTATQRVLGLIFAATIVIPIGDLIIVATARGADGLLNLLLHGVSAAVMAAGSIWLLKSSTHDKMGGNI
ncbi:small membrane hydrophobic protein [Microvirga sp. KLBC 81]|uniref:DUF4267 domain-containing protein n=1 Tax=Microvirga sp. KLBC 81 TaxID=1862707 RepID=UPI000D51AAD0|nr:DUF4267 domain-containing protein [Microvirga sp. KLBC 81]PVE24286.1 small membrane hydrophobic protein [Microvirga sp. KLBC 81]